MADGSDGIDGTRFRLFPEPGFIPTFRRPSVVTVSSPAGSLGPGPHDNRMYAIEPLGKNLPYGLGLTPYGRSFMSLPPWSGDIVPPAEPDEEGHFDYLTPHDPGFATAHAFGSVRFVLDVWERYFGRPVRWHFSDDYERLEIGVLHGFPNAQAGYGFLELGDFKGDDGITRPFALNFDVIAHEVGHLLLYSTIGLPTALGETPEFYGFHESAADMASLLAVAHFDALIDDLMEQTCGNLYLLNRLNRIGALSKNQQIRLASNRLQMRDLAGRSVDEHLLSQPLTGALWDTWVDLFHEDLLDYGLISRSVEELADEIEYHEELDRLIQPDFDAAYADDPAGFKQAFAKARDQMGRLLAGTWRALGPQRLDYGGLVDLLLRVDDRLNNGRFNRIIARNFALRDIGDYSESLVLGGKASHSNSSRVVRPDRERRLRHLSYRERRAIARGE
ncbi:MAG: hypothetical protein ACREEP_06135 [Dongiaceae bacterium]